MDGCLFETVHHFCTSERLVNLALKGAGLEYVMCKTGFYNAGNFSGKWWDWTIRNHGFLGDFPSKPSARWYSEVTSVREGQREAGAKAGLEPLQSQISPLIIPWSTHERILVSKCQANIFC
jgi:hypothetical protein